MVRFIIDGYNLMHALGMSPQSSGLSLERSRVRMLEWFSNEVRDKRDEFCIIFDAVNTSSTHEQTFRGLSIRFSAGETADDLIERLIHDARTPALVTVVSNDRRIQRAAERRGCISWNCGELIDWLPKAHELKRDQQQETKPDKPSVPTSQEVDDWLKRFGS